MNYDTMEAGREMDALVAEKVMGYCVCLLTGKSTMQVHPTNNWGHSCGYRNDVPMARCYNCKKPVWLNKDYFSLKAGAPFSTSISAAWEVVEKMSSTPMGAFQLTEMREGWEAHWPGVDVFAPTAPLAICRAALKTKEFYL